MNKGLKPSATLSILTISKTITIKNLRGLLIVALCLVALATAGRLAHNSQRYELTAGEIPTHSAARTTSELIEAYGKMELSFEANRGQANDGFNYLARGAGYTLALSPTEAVLALAQPKEEISGQTQINQLDNDGTEVRRSSVGQKILRMKLSGANSDSRVEGNGELPGRVNYFIGSDPKNWRQDIPTYSRVKYTDVYPGVDVVYYGNQRQLEYDFVLAPGSDVAAVKLQFDGADGVEVDAAGELVLALDDKTIRQPKPFVYQEVAGVRREVEGSYIIGADGQVGFTVGDYDRSATLVIDPVLVYSTYLGGSALEDGNDITVDSAGNAYVCGETASTNFPTANAFDATFNVGNNPADADAFITKLNAAGSALVYSTYLGGTGTNVNLSGDDICRGIAVDSAGNAYVVGQTRSTDFPTANAIQAMFGGGLFDGFLTKLNAAGNALVYSTFLGGDTFDEMRAVKVDSSGNVYIAGRSTSSNFPTVNPIQSTFNGGGSDATISKINAAGNAFIYSTYLGGGSGNAFDAAFDIDIDLAGNAYITGQTSSPDFPTASPIQATFGGGFPDGDAFAAKLNAAGNALVYSTFIGGSDNDIGFEITVDSSGNAYVAGVADSANFPTANAFQASRSGASDAFVTKLNAAGTAFVYSTYFGGSGDDSGNGIAVNASGEAYLVAGTTSADFPTANPTQGTYGGNVDGTVTRFNAAGSALIFSTYLGGTGGDAALAIALDSAGSIYVLGRTQSTDFPTLTPVQSTNGGGQDAFITKIADSPPATPTPTPTPSPSPSPSPTPGVIEFSASNYPVSEATATVTINVVRTGDTAPAVNVDYATSDTFGLLDCGTVNGSASDRCDYTTALGTLKFAAGETSKSFHIFITDDAWVDGLETAQLTLSNPTNGATLGAQQTATLTISDNDANNDVPNPINDPTFFIGRQYVDLLYRLPDPVGQSNWLSTLQNCPNGGFGLDHPECDRVKVSLGFYFSTEFGERGYLVMRLFEASLGVRPTYREFMRDLQRIGGQLTPAEYAVEKQAYISEFMQRSAFQSLYGGLLTPAQASAFVSALEQTAGVTLANRNTLIDEMQSGQKTAAQTLEAFIDSPEVFAKFVNPGLIEMLYFGYLRRAPDPVGFSNWMQTLNQSGNFRQLVFGFLYSDEYKRRFGQR